MYPLAQTPNSIQLCACGNVRIAHQKMELFLLPFLIDGAEKHTAGFNTHHGSRRQIRNGDAGLPNELFRLIIGVNTAQNCPILAGTVVQSELQELL